MKRPFVGILMGSESDLPVMEKAAEVLKEMGVIYEMDLSSAHRLPEKQPSMPGPPESAASRS